MQTITSESPRIETSQLPILIKLMPHQKAMVYKMMEIEKKLFGSGTHPFAMMSDKPGAGKSYAILTFLYITNRIIFKNNHPHVNIIVVPYNICTQWHTYMSNIYGPPSNSVIKYMLLTEYKDITTLYTRPHNIIDNDVILTTSLYYHVLAQTIKSLNIQVQRVFYDEADTIKNLIMTPMNSKMTWFVSASMYTLFKETKNVTIGTYTLSHQLLKDADVACDPDFVNENITLEAPERIVVQCPSPYFSLLARMLPMEVEKLHALDYRCIRSEFTTDSPTIESESQACYVLYQDATNRINSYKSKIKELQEDLVRLARKYNTTKDVDAQRAI